ncbi:MAG: hypothetical protein AAF483_22375 [Planctomycetota bacterium]
MVRSLATFGLLFVLGLTNESLAQSILIDDFSTDQSLIVNGGVDSLSVTGGGILGSERDVEVVGVVAWETDDGETSITRSATGFTSIASVVFDGLDDDSSVSDGLNGVDLTGGGSTDSLAFKMISVEGQGHVTITVFDDGTNFIKNQDPILFDSAGDIIVPFSFLDSTTGNGVDLGNVNAIKVDFLFVEPGAHNFVIDEIRTANFSVPEPASSGALIGFSFLAVYRRTRRKRTTASHD